MKANGSCIFLNPSIILAAKKVLKKFVTRETVPPLRKNVILLVYFIAGYLQQSLKRNKRWIPQTIPHGFYPNFTDQLVYPKRLLLFHCPQKNKYPMEIVATLFSGADLPFVTWNWYQSYYPHEAARLDLVPSHQSVSHLGPPIYVRCEGVQSGEPPPTPSGPSCVGTGLYSSGKRVLSPLLSSPQPWIPLSW